VVLDAGPARSYDFSRLLGLTVLSPNETEAESLTGIRCDTDEATRRAAAVLLEASTAEHVVMKLGKRGSCIFERDREPVAVPAFAVDAVDATAAGDAYTAALITRYVETGDMAGAARFASAAGAIAVTRLGAQPSLPTREEVTAFLRERGG
jgi:ribokinase